MILQRKLNYLTYLFLCTVINNGNSLKTDKFLSNIKFSSDDILKIIQNLDSEQAQGHDRINVRMLKICGTSICKPFEITFRSCFESGNFQTERKKSKCCSSPSKNDKPSLANYRLILLYLISADI